MLVPDITNPFFPPIIRGVEEAARDRGYELVLCNTDDSPERETASLRLLREHQADGLLIATSRMADTTVAALRRERFPFVLVNRGSRVPADLSVEVDNERAAETVIAHLAGLGHRRIAHIAGPLSTTTGAERAAGYRAAMRARGLPLDAALLEEADAYAEPSGYAACSRLLRARPTAIFAANDLPLVELIDPPLTTIRVPQREMGQIAANMLIAVLEKTPITERHVLLDTTLVIRGSTAARSSAARSVA
jgi:LacI family transcriptional regulator